MTARRPLLVACLGLALAAGLLGGASAARWDRGVTGGAARPSLTGFALLALAGVAALVALAGPTRRVVGGLVALAGGWVAVASAPALPEPAPLLAVAGGLVLLCVGVFVLVREPRLVRVRLGGAPGQQRREPADPDRAAWVALDEGRDPTVDPAGPDGGRGGGAV